MQGLRRAVWAFLIVSTAATLWAAPGKARSVKIGNYFAPSPYGVAIIVDDATAFLIDPLWDDPGKSQYGANDAALAAPGVAAPDFSYARMEFQQQGAKIRFSWGRSGPGAIVARLESDRKVALRLRLPGTTWPQFHAAYESTADGLRGTGVKPSGEVVPFALRATPHPAFVRANVTYGAEIVFVVEPGKPADFVAGVGELPALDSVEPQLKSAGARYNAQRVRAEGDWGDFLGATADSLNNARLYGSDNHRVVHGIGRGWWMRRDPDLFPYFCWDFFFHGLLSSLEDPEGGRGTVRAMLSFQLPDGRVPSFAHWTGEQGTYNTLHRSMPPVGALAVWKMHEWHPSAEFLAEIYPKLVRWHEWWMRARDGNHNGLLEWGSEQHLWQGAQYETGWDDNVTYIGTRLEGTTMNADAVDLSSLWSMDAEYLARIAAALGKAEDARRFSKEQADMNRRINERLWNEKLGIYCSRLWEVPALEETVAPEKAFPAGFNVRWYKDAAFVTETAHQQAAAIDYQWDKAAVQQGVRATAVFTAPETGTYRFKIGGSRYVRFSFDGHQIDHWAYGMEENRTVDLKAEAGKRYPVVVEYMRGDEDPMPLTLTVHRLSPGKPGSDWLTRLTPMNFYPLMAGAADRTRADRTLAWMYREDKFWLPNMLPTVAKDDPVYPEQNYWHGHVWPSANYLVWQGVRRYADPAHQSEFARRSVNLFMRNWNEARRNCENFNSTDGKCGGHPHYTWSGLMNLIGLEALVDVGPDFRPLPRKFTGAENMELQHLPFGGRQYSVHVKGGQVTVEQEGTAR